MPADTDLLFGKIALSRGYCAQEKVDLCLALQASSKDHLPLGRILVNEGYLTEDQHSEILAIQRKQMMTLDPLIKRRKESILFGKLAVKEGLLTAKEANECLRLQAMKGEKRTLGEIMAAQGHLTGQQVKDLLSRQSKRIMSCPACRLSFTVLTISQGKRIDCPRCKGPLKDGKPDDSTRTDGEFSTRIFVAVKAEIPPAPKAPQTAPVRATCAICGHAFEGVADSTGRLQCPACHTTFIAP